MVTVALTVLTKSGDNFEASYKILPGGRGKILAFLSGGAELKHMPKGFEIVGASSSQKPQALSRDFEERLQKVDSRNLDKQSLLASKGKWSEGVNRAWNNVRSGLIKVHNSIDLSKEDVYQTFQDTNKTHVEESLRGVLNFGSAVDSEQYLLRYLKEDSDGEKRIIDLCHSVKGRHTELKLDILKEEIRKATNEAAGLIPVKNYFSTLEVGYILHLHSTNEICSCCAYSLATDLLYSGISEEIVQMSKEQNKGKSEHEFVDPFFIVSVSCSQMLSNEGEVDYYRRVGIGEKEILSEGEYTDNGGEKLVRMNAKIHKESFIQKFIGTPTKIDK